MVGLGEQKCLSFKRDNMSSPTDVPDKISNLAQKTGWARPDKIQDAILYSGVALIALFPVVYFNALLSRLFWFGDDFAFISDIRQLGFSSWFPSPFGENFLPLFKGYWSAIFFLGGGSAALAIEANWVLHAFNTVLLARLLRLMRFSRLASATGAAMFAIAAANVEVLTWSMGGSTILACTFLLLAMVSHVTPKISPGVKTFRTFGWIVAGTLSHARGVIAGPALAATEFFGDAKEVKTGARLFRSALLVLPSVAVGTTIFLLAPDNHQQVLGSGNLLLRAGRFGFWYIAANPFVPLLAANGRSWTCFALSTSSVLALGVLKFAIMFAAWKGTRGPRRAAVIALIVAELCTAALLGLGRSEGEPPLAMSSRYQYGSLICTIPLVLAAIEAVGEKWSVFRKFSKPILGALLAAGILWNIALWQDLLPPWVRWRGEGTRKILSATSRPEGRDLPGADFLTNDEARSLVKRYDLH